MRIPTNIEHLELAKRVHNVLEYCIGKTDQMWAARIVSEIFGCDFRDSTECLKDYFRLNKLLGYPLKEQNLKEEGEENEIK